MKRSSWIERIIAVNMLLLLLGGCSAPAATDPAKPSPTLQAPAPTLLPPTLSATATPSPEPLASPEPRVGDTSTRPADGMVMVYVPAGSFQMGSSQAEIEAALALCQEYPDPYGKCQLENFALEAPQHRVSLEGFWLDRGEVSNVQYALCVEAGACQPSRLADDDRYNGDDYPVAGIPWQDAADYCAWAGAQLPSEAEWEYAARGEGNQLYPWGERFDCAGGNFDQTHADCDDGFSGPSPVGSFPAGSSWCGAWDLAGNVWEWVADPYNQANSDRRILRGGSWAYGPAFVRGATRYPVPPEADYAAVGFRCALSAGE